MLDKTFLRLKYWFFPCKENDYRPRFLGSSFLYYYAIVLLIFKIFIISIFFYLPKTSFFADITKTSLVQLANQARQSLGFGLLINNPKLDEAAYLKAQDMFKNDYFAHNSPGGLTPWFWFETAGYDYKYAGENLAIGFVDSDEVSQAWLDSPSHRKNILNDKYNEIGLAVVLGEFQGSQTTIVVQLFGAAKTPAALVPEIVAEQETFPAQREELAATSSSPLVTELAQNPSKEVLAAYAAAGDSRNFSTKFFSFLVSDFNIIFQKIIYGSLFLIIFLLVVTVLIDIFAYHAYEIQHKDIFFKTLVLCAIFALLLIIDKETIISIIPHNLGIY